MALMNIFDICDADDDGLLSRKEFDVYNTRTCDQHVTDDEWKILIG